MRRRLDYNMPTANKSLISDLQSQTLHSKVQDDKRVVDLNYSGYDRNSDKSFERYEGSAHRNRLMLWLSSHPYDYVRSNTVGGVIYSLLKRSVNDSNLEDWKQEIQERFNEEFSQDLTLLLLNLSFNSKSKTLVISMIVRDNLTKEAISITTEATI